MSQLLMFWVLLSINGQKVDFVSSHDSFEHCYAAKGDIKPHHQIKYQCVPVHK